jgi:hypothetical protein
MPHQGDTPSATIASTYSYKVDPNWYSDTGATDHITSDLHRLTVHQQYHGGDQVQVNIRAGLHIKHIGHCSINISSCTLVLNNVFMFSISPTRLFFEFHPSYYLIKD